MAQKQKRVSIFESEWEIAKQYLEKHKNELLRKEGINSPTELIRFWIREHA